ncbi:hypothetical protein LUZ63_019870 [Rhynchospora breviuscula]|uniref:Uncharacterized protein n=1 Tax=Rhynchospora breviuscula TaxID=2022672 RepID=A0A9Q0C729_9POAL|nr:hypothetical protein LUZ63_019870 [Rhynchospora breviuscula]
MAVQIGSSSSSFFRSSSSKYRQLGKCTLQFQSGQNNVITLFHGARDSPTGSHNSRKGFYVKRLVLSYSTSAEINPSSPEEGNPELLEDYSFELATKRTDGKPGFISFQGLPYKSREEATGYRPLSTNEKVHDIVWFVGPTVLVSFLVLPSLYLRKILSLVFEDSLLTDFLILFFTEALFYIGVLIFVLLTDLSWRRRSNQAILPKLPALQNAPRYFQILSVTMKVLNLIIPLVTMGLVWPWTGPAASATLAPYLVGLVVQFAFEQYARRKKSPSWPVIPVIFQVYRLHQLNRAAQLVTALTFSVRSAETTAQTSAITNSLGALLIILQILGVICIWSLSSFIMRYFPSTQNES